MQSKLVIAALIGAVSTKDLEKIKHAMGMVQSIQNGISKTFHGIQNTIDHGAEDVEVSLGVESLLRSENDITKIEGIVGGILKGALKAEGFDDINSCISDAETIFKDAEEAFADFKTKDVTKIVAGIEKLADLLQHVKAGMKDCTQSKIDWTSIVQMIEVLKTPSSFAVHIGKDLLVNGNDIYHEIEDAIDSYEKENWEQFGIDVGMAAAKTILGEEAPVATLGSEDKMKLAQIEQGILKAYGGEFDLLALLECIGAEDKALLVFDAGVQSFESAFNDIKQKDPQDAIGDAIGGVIAFVAGVATFKQGLPACKAIDSSSFDFKQLDASYDIAAHPLKHFEMMEEDLLLNGVPIKKMARKALKAYRNKNYVKFGHQIGSILQLASVEQAAPVETSLPVEEDIENIKDRKMVTEVAQGFLKSTKVGTFNFTNLLECIYVADQSALILYEAIDILEESFKDKDPQEAIGGIIAVVAFVQQLKQTIPVCESVDERSMDWSHFNNIVDVVESPEKHMTLIENDIIFNEVTITNELSQALDAFRSMEYLDFGYKLGEVMYLATETPANLHLY